MTSCNFYNTEDLYMFIKYLNLKIKKECTVPLSSATGMTFLFEGT